MGWSQYRPVGLSYHDPQRAYRGYTVVVPNGGLPSNEGNELDHFGMLIDMEGRVCQRWEFDGGLKYGFLLPNGNLLARTRAPDAIDGIEAMGGSSAKIVELDWNSNVVWSYETSMIHHDFERLPNGNTLVLAWDRIPADLSARVNGGYTTSGDPDSMYGDVVLEITPTGLVSNEWRSWEHLDTQEDVICSLEGRVAWTYGNSIGVAPGGDLIVSYRSTSVVGIVDRTSGNFKWKWGPGQISHQHHPTYLPNGRVLMFDNGVHGVGTVRSRVIEVDPNDENRIVWQYVGNPPASFFSPLTSSADRLPNGNTLICEGSSGRIFEITREHEIVWEYTSPWVLPVFGGQSNALFRAHRYGLDHPALAGKDLNPERFANLNQTQA